MVKSSNRAGNRSYGERLTVFQQLYLETHFHQNRYPCKEQKYMMARDMNMKLSRYRMPIVCQIILFIIFNNREPVDGEPPLLRIRGIYNYKPAPAVGFWVTIISFFQFLFLLQEVEVPQSERCALLRVFPQLRTIECTEKYYIRYFDTKTTNFAIQLPTVDFILVRWR
uniref:Homeobox domain-containing protein n=1 Tax=Caenorhabditis tropicalis TaxID=1561998 RepID=A0A1I7T8X6_9PELO